jgi:hypothetical protein
MGKSKLIFGVTKLVSEHEERLSNSRNVVLSRFTEAYEELRRACPKGTLRIHLSVEADSAAEVGVVFDDDNLCWCSHHRLYHTSDNRCLVPDCPCREGLHIVHDHKGGVPPQWNCSSCGYGEYKNREDWEARAVEHLKVCTAQRG